MFVVRAAALVLGLLSATLAHATAQRAFVSTAGVDNPACSLVAPCRTFGAAITATSPGGEVIALDSGGYGPVTITKSVSIVAPAGIYAGISVFSGTGVTIAAGASDTVTLRGLAITFQGGAYGVFFAAGAQLVIDRCVIVGAFTSGGVDINGPTNADVLVRDTQISGSDTGLNATGGVYPGNIRLTVESTVMRDVLRAIHIFGPAAAVIANSQLIGRALGYNVIAGSYGVQEDNAGLQHVTLHITSSLVRNFDIGVDITEGGPDVTGSITESELANNATAVSAKKGAIVGLSGNRFVQNGSVLFKDPVNTYVYSSGTNYEFNGGLGSGLDAIKGLY